MNCQSLTSLTSWRCKVAGRNSIQAISPFTLGKDGLHASFYVMQEDNDRFFITDAHQAVLHAAEMGISFSDARCRKIAATPGVRFAGISGDGEISATADAGTLRFALWDAVKLALAVSNREEEWLPRTNQERFATQVRKFLEARIDRAHITNKPVIVGASGHNVEFPFGIVAHSRTLRYVQPIALSDTGRLDWGFVYQTFGKFSDIKHVSEANLRNRIVLIESGATPDEHGKAATLLAEAAEVLLYRPHESLIETLLAA